jgi:Tol biopolymer transport system component
VTASGSTSASVAASFPSPSPRVVRDGVAPVLTGVPIDTAELAGRIVFDNFEDVFAMDVDGSNVVAIASNPAGPEFDGAWSPDGASVVYRDSTRGINVDDEIYVAGADGSQKRNLTDHPANDWGPDWSPDGSTIAFNSDRDGGAIRAYAVDTDGSDLRRLPIDGWVEYPAFSPDGRRIAYMGAVGSNYEIFVADVDTGERTQLTSSPGHDGWPAWSPDGSAIAFSSVRDDCSIAPPHSACRSGEDDDEHEDIWLVAPDGSNLRRVTHEAGQFVTWSPDSRYLLISGRSLYVVRPDGTGRLELRAEGIELPLGGIPDWRRARGQPLAP